MLNFVKKNLWSAVFSGGYKKTEQSKKQMRLPVAILSVLEMQVKKN